MALVALVLLPAACSSEPAPVADEPSEEIHVSRLTPDGPKGRRWIPESRVDPAPQRNPWMVMWEVTRYPHAERPTPEQQAAADDLVRRSHESAQRHGWNEFLKGVADGYKPAVGDDTHYGNDAYLLDDAILDPDRPEFLMYYETPEGRTLAGFMYYVRRPDERGPQIGGPLTIWHYHVWARRHCLVRGMIGAGVVDDEGRCAAGKPTHRSPEMLHVWFVDHPFGPFATQMTLPPGVIESARWD